MQFYLLSNFGVLETYVRIYMKFFSNHKLREKKIIPEYIYSYNSELRGWRLEIRKVGGWHYRLRSIIALVSLTSRPLK